MEQLEGCYGCWSLARRITEADATIAALQARVQVLEAEVDTLTQQEESWESQLTQRTAECDALKLVNDTHMKTVMKLSHIVEQQTAELEAAKAQHKDLVLRNRILRDRPDLPVERTSFHDEVVKLQAELERVRGLVRALPAYKDISVSHRIDENDYESWHVWVDHNPLAECDTEEEANAIKALYEHRQGMEG